MQAFNALLVEGKTQNDLKNRVQIINSRNGDNDGSITSILTIANPTVWDEGYYTCRSINNRNNEIISSRLYIFIYGS